MTVRPIRSQFARQTIDAGVVILLDVSLEASPAFLFHPFGKLVALSLIRVFAARQNRRRSNFAWRSCARE